jgi:hypothetical protein
LTTTARPAIPKKASARATKQPAAPVAEEASVPVSEEDPGVQTGVQPAYLSYLRARKGVANAFKGRQRQDDQAYEDSQRRYQAYEEAIDEALKARQKAEREAADLYRAAVDSAVEKASGEYRNRMRQALAECKSATDSAWKASMETSFGMTGVFESDRLVQKEEKPESSSRWARFGSNLRDDMVMFKKGCLVVARRGSHSLKRLVRRDGKRTEAGAVESQP